MIKLLEILNEQGNRNQFVLITSRDVVNAFKSGQNSYKETYPVSRGGEDLNIDVYFQFKKRPKQDNAFSIAASFGPTKSDDSEDILEAVIEYNPSKFPSAMNALVAEIKETLEHEYEHAGQQTYDDMFVMSNRYDEPLAYPENSPQAPTHFLYLTSNIEVPAYVKGLIKRARVKKISFDQALEEYYDDYKSTFTLHKTDWSAVKRIWMQWYNQNKHKLKKTV
jgi:hypothetical protein